MKIVFTAVNAKFIHSSLALRSIREYCGEIGKNIEIAEYTINNDVDYIVNELYIKKPDVIAFSCYIWNMKIITEIIEVLRKILPKVIIIVGGPEVSYEFEDLFEKGIDIVSVGEGEATFKKLIPVLESGRELRDVKGIAFKKNEEIIFTGMGEIVSLDDIPFVYFDRLKELENRIIYYEASRGCPYKCQYCLSSVENGVRFLSIERVFSDLRYFIENNVKQVKFVDRTFNCNKRFALSIWTFLIENDNGISNFHFEISADIIDDDMLKILSKARKGLFQFEIGVQSTNENTLEKITRKTDSSKVFEIVKKIKKMKNIHQHLDLIAGLPEENYTSFRKSFNDVFEVRPEQLQLGFLKLLKGSGLRRDAQRFGIVYRNRPPYEVLYTKEISYSEMMRLKGIEEMTEIYYNSGKAYNTIMSVIRYFGSGFDFFERLSIYWEENRYYDVLHNKMKLYTILYEFLKDKCDLPIEDILKFDIFMNDNVKKFPQWLKYDSSEETKKARRKFFNDYIYVKKYISGLSGYTGSQLSRMCHLERFDFNIEKWIESDYTNIERKVCYVLFNYHNENDLKGNISYRVIEENINE